MNNIKSKVLLMLSLLLIFDSAAFSMDPGDAIRSAADDTIFRLLFKQPVAAPPLTSKDPFLLIDINDFRLKTNGDVRNVILNALSLPEDTFTVYTGTGDLHEDARFYKENILMIHIINLTEEQKKTAMVTLQGNRDANATKSEPLKILSDRLRGDEKESLSAKIKALDNENILDPTRLADDILALSESVKTGFFVPKVKNLIDRLVAIVVPFAAVTG